MQLKPLLLQTMTDLGVTPDELVLLQGRMLSAVSSLQANLVALDAQISTLQRQREEVAAELGQASTTVMKLVDPDPEPLPEVPVEPTPEPTPEPQV
jgi:hypothetical protein